MLFKAVLKKSAKCKAKAMAKSAYERFLAAQAEREATAEAEAKAEACIGLQAMLPNFSWRQIADFIAARLARKADEECVTVSVWPAVCAACASAASENGAADRHLAAQENAESAI